MNRTSTSVLPRGRVWDVEGSVLVVFGDDFHSSFFGGTGSGYERHAIFPHLTGTSERHREKSKTAEKSRRLRECGSADDEMA